MKTLLYIRLIFILLFVNSFSNAQTITGFSSPTDACGSAPTVNLSPGTSCSPLSSVTRYTTGVNMFDATYTSGVGNLPTCNGGSFAGVAMSSSMTDKWIKLVTDANTQGIGLVIDNILATGTNSVTNLNIALYKTTACPGAVNPIDIQWSANTPAATNCDNVSIASSSFGTDPYYIDLDPSSTYYMRIFTTSTSGQNDRSYDIEITPFPTPPSNGNNTSTSAPCTNALNMTGTTTGCNYGALPAPWLSGSSIQTPDGCSWSRAENSLFYQFTRPSGNFTITLQNITCAGGGISLQSAVFKQCPSPTAGTAINEFTTSVATASYASSGGSVQCTSTSSGGAYKLIVYDGGAAGGTYYLWVDGTSGSICTWSITIQSSLGFLPVELTSFDLNNEPNKTVKLSWQTASEIRNEKFIVERSENGNDFYAIGEVKGNGTTRERQDYELIDTKPKPGILYYRLKQMDYDGKYEIHKTVSTEISIDDFIVFPNPSRDIISLSFKNKDLIPEKIELMNYTSELINSEVHQIESIYNFDIKHLPEGIYFIKVHYPNGVQVKNFIISK